MKKYNPRKFLSSRAVALVLIFTLLSVTYGVLVILDSKSVGLEDVGQIPGRELSKVEGPPMYSMKNKPVWDRENSFMNLNIYYRQGVGPDLRSKEQNQISLNSKAVKVVIFGDSFIWGHGSLDENVNIGSILQRELDARTGVGVFNVLVEGRNSDSTYNYADLYTREKIKELGAKYVVYAYFENDSIPSFNESLICGKNRACNQFTPESAPAYQRCVSGTDSLFGKVLKNLINPNFPSLRSELTVRHCNGIIAQLKKKTFDVTTLGRNPSENPWWELWGKAVKQLSENLSSTHFYMANLISPIPMEKDVEDVFNKEFKLNNFDIIPMSTSRKAIKTIPQNQLYINPSNGHSGPALNYSYAVDIANHLLKTVNPAEISVSQAETKRLGLKNGNFIIDTVLPNKMIVSNFSGGEVVEFPIQSPDPKVKMTIAGMEVPVQLVPCAELGYSHIDLNLNPNLKGKTLVVKRKPGSIPGELTVTMSYYQSDYVKSAINAIPTGEGLAFTIPIDAQAISLHVGDTKVNNGCSIKEVVNLYPFTLELKVSNEK